MVNASRAGKRTRQFGYTRQSNAGRPERPGHLEEETPMHKLLAAVFAACAVLVAGVAPAQPYPAKPVKLIVTYPPGGSSDLMARVFGQKLGEVWGQTVIIESKPGAAGSIGMDFAAKQAPDGYSFVVGNIGPAAVNPLLSKVPYDIQRDFVAISLISTGPNILIVHPDVPAKSLRELTDYAKSSSGKLNYGTSGPGSISHLAGAMYTNITGVKATEVPYKGGILGVQDLGVEAVYSTPEQFVAFMKSETAKYAKLIKEAGIKVE